MPLSAEETELIGQWKLVDGKMVGDCACKRIERLVAKELQHVATDDSGWLVLYIDPADNRYWELTYPQGDLQGGGPPKLTVISEAEAAERYRIPR